MAQVHRQQLDLLVEGLLNSGRRVGVVLDSGFRQFPFYGAPGLTYLSASAFPGLAVEKRGDCLGAVKGSVGLPFFRLFQ